MWARPVRVSIKGRATVSQLYFHWQLSAVHFYYVPWPEGCTNNPGRGQVDGALAVLGIMNLLYTMRRTSGWSCRFRIQEFKVHTRFYWARNVHCLAQLILMPVLIPVETKARHHPPPPSIEWSPMTSMTSILFGVSLVTGHEVVLCPFSDV